MSAHKVGQVLDERIGGQPYIDKQSTPRRIMVINKERHRNAINCQ